MDSKMCVGYLKNVRKMFVLGCERCEGEALKYQHNFISALNYAIELINDTERSQGEWGKWVISEIRCPECLEYFDTDCYSTEELKKCPSCGATMKGGA